MVLNDFNEITYLKDSEILLQKINEIKNVLHNTNCTTKLVTGIFVKKNEIHFDLRITFPLPR
jgi:hypothetical protein